MSVRRTMLDDVCCALPCSRGISEEEMKEIKSNPRRARSCIAALFLLFGCIITMMQNNNKPPKGTYPMLCQREKPSSRRIVDRRIFRRKWISNPNLNLKSKRSLSLNTKEVTKEIRWSTYYVLRGWWGKKVL